VQLEDTRVMPLRALRQNQSLDVPDVVFHMTGRNGKRRPEVPEPYQHLSPPARLANILFHHGLGYHPPFGGDWSVACFSQITRPALAGLVGERYDGTGIAFHKQAVFDAGGGPVLYVRGDEFAAWRASVTPAMAARMVRYWPGVDVETPGEFFQPLEVVKESQWMMEREWRIVSPTPTGGAWQFNEADIAFLLLDGALARMELLEMLRSWGMDTALVEALPVAFVERHGHAMRYVGAEALWPDLTATT